MYNNYPNIFKNSCVKNISCNTNSNFTCKNGLDNINNELNKLKKENSHKNIDKDKEKGKICSDYSSPLEVYENSSINFDLLNNHSWSNQRGYGNIQISSFDSCNNIKGEVFNWNRIPKQYKPYSSPANVNIAWSKNS